MDYLPYKINNIILYYSNSSIDIVSTSSFLHILLFLVSLVLSIPILNCVLINFRAKIEPIFVLHL